MAETINFIWSWLESGYNLATGNAKSTWNETKVIFKMAIDALTSISKNFQGYISYSLRSILCLKTIYVIKYFPSLLYRSLHETFSVLIVIKIRID